jgi:hypothetical protein
MTLNLSTLYGSVGPANSDIATAVAGAVPTISAINTSVANNAPSPSNWTVISTISITSQTVITFSSLSGYKTYKLVGSVSATNSSRLLIRLNNDTTGNYNYYVTEWPNGNTYPGVDRGPSSSAITTTYSNMSGSNTNMFEANINSANTSGIKFVTGSVGFNSAGFNQNCSATFYGYYPSGPITRIDIQQSGGSYNGGSITLLGAN